ncbi:MAG: PilN domain-containing protein [Phycisphaerales bacterium]
MTSTHGRVRVPVHGRVAVVYTQGDTARLLVLRPGKAPVVESATSLPALDRAGLAAALSRAKPAAVVCLIPAGRVVVRPIKSPAPEGDVAHIAGALDLVAEAELSGSYLSHRRAGAVLRGTGDAPGAVLALGWTGDGAPSLADPVRQRSVPVIHVPEPLALVALAQAASAGWGASVQPASGLLTLCTRAGGHPTLRVHREDPEDTAGWAALVQGQLAGLGDAAALEHDRSGLHLDPAGSLATISGASTDAAWLGEFGLALGAALACTSPDPGLHCACAMTPSAPVPYRPAIVRAAEILAVPGRAATVIGVCVAIALLGPLGLAVARHQVLKGHAAASGEDDSESLAAQKQAEMYQLLKDRRWPMTKLLADLTASMPQGVTLETLSLEYGKDVRVTGLADSTDLVSQWRDAINRSRVFDNARAPSIDSSRFELTARVAQPFGAAGALAARSTTSPVTAAVPARPAPQASAPEPAPGRGSGGTGRAGAAPASPATATPKVPVMPGALSDGQIETMDLATATREWGQRKAAAGRPGVSEADKQRLLAEAEKLQARRRTLQSAGGGQ